jgi:hypothetical protein
MLPPSYGVPAAVVLAVGGALACFAGYRLFKFVLAIYGFIFGAMFASSMMAPSQTMGMLIAAVLGGLAGAAILLLAYFVGIALLGAGLGALITHVLWQRFGTGDPPIALVILLAVFGAMGAMLLQRYVIVVSTAFGGAWTLILGGLAMSGDRAAAKAASAGDVWILYPTTVPPQQRWVPIAWGLIGLVGMIVQLGVTGRKRRKG